tara:strand:+ start:2092 stop:3117 length:1026 start_codon:yes stop_codon:yes gene_type:complete
MLNLKMTKSRQIFIVGSSRSGTTMMGRILANHKDIFTFKELHFFGTIWTLSDNQKLTKKKQIDLMSLLLCIQNRGIFDKKEFADFSFQAKQILKNKHYTNPMHIYKFFLDTITKENAATISCEQTPKNLYYIEEILNFFPEALIVNLVRDQRDVLLSQKNKWRRKFLGANKIPFFEALRSYINYHPITIARIWRSSLSYTSKFKNHKRVKVVKFEELLHSPRNVVEEVCKFLKIKYSKDMLNVPLIGSSTKYDSKINFIDKSKINNWKNGGLSKAEIYLSQKFSKDMMQEFGYREKEIGFFPPLVLYYQITFPIKLCISFIFNIHRMGNILEVIKKRFFCK